MFKQLDVDDLIYPRIFVSYPNIQCKFFKTFQEVPVFFDKAVIGFKINEVGPMLT